MLIIQPDVELMKHNYYHYAYHTGTENYSLRRRRGGDASACAYVKYILSCAHSTRQRRMRDTGGEGEEREDGGWKSGVIIMHVGQEIKVTCFRIN